MRNSDDPITWPILHRWAALHPTLGGEIDCFGSRGPGPGEPSGQIASQALNTSSVFAQVEDGLFP